MTKRLITILLLLSFGVMPAAVQAYHIGQCIAESLQQMNEGDEMMSCCKSAGGCKMNMQASLEFVSEDNSQPPCFCADENDNAPVGLIVNAPQNSKAFDSVAVLPRPPCCLENNFVKASYHVTSHRKLSKTYLRFSCLRI